MERKKWLSAAVSGILCLGMTAGAVVLPGYWAEARQKAILETGGSVTGPAPTGYRYEPTYADGLLQICRCAAGAEKWMVAEVGMEPETLGCIPYENAPSAAVAELNRWVDAGILPEVFRPLLQDDVLLGRCAVDVQFSAGLPVMAAHEAHPVLSLYTLSFRYMDKMNLMEMVMDPGNGGIYMISVKLENLPEILAGLGIVIEPGTDAFATEDAMDRFARLYGLGEAEDWRITSDEDGAFEATVRYMDGEVSMCVQYRPQDAFVIRVADPMIDGDTAAVTGESEFDRAKDWDKAG